MANLLTIKIPAGYPHAGRIGRVIDETDAVVTVVLERRSISRPAPTKQHTITIMKTDLHMRAG